MKIFPCQLPEEIKRNIRNLGVSHRYLVDHGPFESESIMDEAGVVAPCVEACGKTLELAGLSVGDIGYFVTTYDVSPVLCPGLSQLLVRKLGFGPHVRYVNIQGMACTAFTKALELVQAYLAMRPEDFALICVSGVNSYWFYNQVSGIDDVMEISRINAIKDDKRRRVELRKWIAALEFFLFGDGVASLVVADKGTGLAVGDIVEVTNFGDADYLAGYARLVALNEPLKFGFYSHLDREIPRLGVKYISAVLERLFGEDVGDVLKGVRKLCIHTGSEKILRIIAEHYGIEFERLEESYEVLRDFGNLAGASLPFILEKAVSGDGLVEDDVILTLGYGWGFSASGSCFRFVV